MQNFISIITPCYNTKIEYLEKCLNSIKNQTYKNFECIIVNDCSTDVKTIDFIKEYIKTNKNFYLINNEKNLGCGMTRENGLKHAKGNIIMFSDSDDWWELNAFEMINDIFSKNNDLDIFSFNFFVDDIKQNQCYNGFSCNAIIDPNLTVNILNDKPMVWSKAYSFKFLKSQNIKHFDSNKYGEDVYYQILAYTRAKKFYVTDTPLIHYRQQNTTDTLNFNANFEKKANDLLFYLDNAYQTIKNDDTIYAKNWKHVFNYLFTYRIVNFFIPKNNNQPWVQTLLEKANKIYSEI